MFTNDSDVIHTSEVGEPVATSDHNIVRLKLNLQMKTKDNGLLTPKYKNNLKNMRNMGRALKNVNWERLLDVACTDEMYNNFTIKFKVIKKKKKTSS